MSAVGMVQQAREWFQDADVLMTVQNTYRPVLDGTRRRVSHVGASYFNAVMLDGPQAGQECRGVIPSRARDIISIDRDIITVRLGGPAAAKGEHTVTYRKLDWRHRIADVGGEQLTEDGAVIVRLLRDPPVIASRVYSRADYQDSTQMRRVACNQAARLQNSDQAAANYYVVARYGRTTAVHTGMHSVLITVEEGTT